LLLVFERVYVLIISHRDVLYHNVRKVRVIKFVLVHFSI
jgi:hypothetical protein